MMYLRKLCFVAVLLLVSAQCFAAGSIAGNIIDQKDKGQYESEIFACKTGTSTNSAYYRLDTAGYYNLTSLSAGTYSLGLSDNFHFMPRLRSFVPVTDGKVTPGSFTIRSTYFNHGDYYSGGSPQYAEFRQTFVATGHPVKITAWVIESGFTVHASFHDASTGAQIGPTKDLGVDDRGTAKWLHGQVPLTVGTTYYVKLIRNGINTFSMKYKSGNPYSGGCLYYGSVAQPDLDMSLVIESDDAGLSTMYQRSINNSGSSSSHLGQTFKAIGSNITVVTLFATADVSEGRDVAFSILSGGPTGAQIGPTKTVKVRDYRPMGQWVAVTWEPGEVPVTSGQTYYLKMTSTNLYIFTATTNPYPDGCFYVAGSPVSNTDMLATIMGETTANSSLGTLSGTVTNSGGSPLSGATIATTPFGYTATSGTSGTYSLSATADPYYVKCTKPYYQQGTVNLTLTPGGTTTQNFSLAYTGSLLQNTNFEYGFTSGVANSWTSYVVSGSPSFLKETYFIHGGTASQRWWTSWYAHDAGIYQQVAATSGTGYTLTAWTWRRDSTGGGKEASKIGIDPYGGTSPTSANVVWSTTSTAMDTWVQQSVVATAQSSTITIFIRGTATATGEAMITCVDDCALVAASSTGAISGTVKTTGGVGIVGATVYTNIGGYTTTSGTGGAYTLSSVVPATYSVTAKKIPDYYWQTVSNVVVNPAQTTTCNFTLLTNKLTNPGIESGSMTGWTNYNDGLVAKSGSGYGGITPRTGSWWCYNAASWTDPKTGGSYQRVAVTSGKLLTAVVYTAIYGEAGGAAHSWSRVGIDPAGGTDPASANVQWCSWVNNPTDLTWSWVLLTKTATATASYGTFFMDYKQDPTGGGGAYQWQVNGFDDAIFVCAQ